MDLTEDVLRQFCVPVLCSFLFVTRLMTNVETSLLVQLLIKFTISFSEQILKLWSFYLFVVQYFCGKNCQIQPLALQEILHFFCENSNTVYLSSSEQRLLFHSRVRVRSASFVTMVTRCHGNHGNNVVTIAPPCCNVRTLDNE